MYEVVRRVMVPFRKVRIPGAGNRYFDLTQPQLLANKLFASVRGRVEHVNAYMVNHDMFEGRPFRASPEFLKWYVDITVHCTALLIRTETTRQLPGWPDDGVGHPHRPI